MAPIKVVVHGVLGRMGQQVLDTVCREPDLTPVGGADGRAQPGSHALPDGTGQIPLSNSLDEVVDGADVVVDFSSAEGAMSVMRTASAHYDPRHEGVNCLVVGYSAAWGVGQRYSASTIDFHQTRDTQHRVRTEAIGIEKVIVDATVDHVHPLETLGRTHVDIAILNDQIGTLH